jgi:hypothetical protein
MNAARLRAFSERTAQVGEALWPATVTIAAVDYAGERVTPAGRGQFMPGYESDTTECVIRIRKTLLATAPARDSFLTVSGTDWQIREIGGDNACDACWVLKCEKKK